MTGAGSSTRLSVATDERGVARITMSRPEVHNAFDEHLIAELTEAVGALGRAHEVRVVVLAGAGKSFSAGADLGWMRRMADQSEQANLEDARRLAHLMRSLYEMPKPTIAAVGGAALGGGVGLICACDLAIASDHAVFGTTEVRLGLIPSVIGPYVVTAVGPRHARRLMVTGGRIGADEALRIGLVHEVVPGDELEGAVESVIGGLLKNGPQAMAEAKRLAHELTARPLDDRMIDDTAQRIAVIRSGAEGKEGVAAFLEKRPPGWR